MKCFLSLFYSPASISEKRCDFSAGAPSAVRGKHPRSYRSPSKMCVFQHLRFNVSSFYHTQELPSSGSWDSPDSPLATTAFGSFDETLFNRRRYLLRYYSVPVVGLRFPVGRHSLAPTIPCSLMDPGSVPGWGLPHFCLVAHARRWDSDTTLEIRS